MIKLTKKVLLEQNSLKKQAFKEAIFWLACEKSHIRI